MKLFQLRAIWRLPFSFWHIAPGIYNSHGSSPTVMRVAVGLRTILRCQSTIFKVVCFTTNWHCNRHLRKQLTNVQISSALSSTPHGTWTLFREFSPPECRHVMISRTAPNRSDYSLICNVQHDQTSLRQKALFNKNRNSTYKVSVASIFCWKTRRYVFYQVFYVLTHHLLWKFNLVSYEQVTIC